jgi:hypothetical protein
VSVSNADTTFRMLLLALWLLTVVREVSAVLAADLIAPLRPLACGFAVLEVPVEVSIGRPAGV